MQAPPAVPPSLPTEIVCRILSASRYFEGDSIFPPGAEGLHETYGDYKYRYTRFALKARRVCRLWRDIVDIPSNYWFRVSNAALYLDLAFEIDVGSAGNVGPWVRPILTPSELGKLQEIISLSSKSFLVLTLDIPFMPIITQPDTHKQNSNFGVKDIQSCFNPSAKRRIFQGHIIWLAVTSDYGKYQDCLPEIIEIFGYDSIRRVSLLWNHASTDTGSKIISNASGIPEADLKWTPRKALLMQFPYLENLSLKTRHRINELCHLPPFVTELQLDGDGVHFGVAFLELRLVLVAIGSQLKILNAGITPLTEAEADRLSPDRELIHLPKLTSITLGKGPVNFTNFLLELDCPKLEKASVTEGYYPRESGYISRRANVSNPQVQLPALRILRIAWCTKWSFLPLEALSMPSLQSLSIVEERDSEALKLEGLSIPICKRLSALSLRSLHIYSDFKKGIGVLTSLFKYLNLQFIEELYINHSSILDFFKRLPKLPMPQLRYLELAQTYYPTLDTLSLDQVVLGEKLDTFRLTAPLRNPKDVQKLYGIKTLVLSRHWDESALVGTISSKLTLLLPLFPNLTSLCFTDRDLNEFEDFLSVLSPNSCSDQIREGVIPKPNEESLFGSSQLCNNTVPRLQHLTVELRVGYELHHVDDWRPEIIQIISKINTQRRAAGAASLLSLTIVILQDRYEEQEVIDYPPESEGGILCRVLLADEQRLPSNLLTKDQINREHQEWKLSWFKLSKRSYRSRTHW